MNIFITGASSGFGKLAVELLISKGHQVCAGIRGGQERGEELFPYHSSSSSLSFVDIHMDDSKSIREMSKSVLNLFNGRLDVLINNAGFGLIGPMEDLSMEQIRHQFEVNVFGLMELTNCMLPSLRQSHGKIINVSSMGGRIAIPFYGAYNASKFALEGYSEALHLELAPHGVQVAIIEPGAYKTKFLHGSSKWANKDKEDSPFKKDYLAFIERQEDIFSKTAKDPMQVARLMTYLVQKEKLSLRYPVGVDSFVLTFLSKYIPTDLWIFFNKLAYNFMIRQK